MKQKICPTCDGKLKGNYCPFCHKIVRKPLEWDVRYYLNERHPDWETNCDYHGESQVLEQAESAGSASAFNMSEGQETVFQSAQPDIEFDNPYKRSSKRAVPQILEQAESAGSASAFNMSEGQETVFQSAQPDIEFDNPYKRSSKRAVPQINVSPTEKPKKKGRIGKIVLTAVGVCVVLNIIMAVIANIDYENAVPQINVSPTEKPKKKGRIGKIVLTAVGVCVVLNIIMAVIANIDYEKVPEPLASEEAYENAIEIPVPDFTEETGIVISEEEWNYEEGVKELSDEEVKERREMGLGDRCSTYFHLPVSYEAFAGKIEDYLANAGLSIDSYDEYTVNLLYSYGEEAEEFSSYNRTMEWYVLEPGMEETDYWSGVSLSSDTASGEIHWFEVALEDREQAFQIMAWAAETIGELAGFSNAKETAEQIYTELSSFEGEEEFWYADISEYSVSVWEYEGKTEVRLELSYDFAQKLSLD